MELKPLATKRNRKTADVHRQWRINLGRQCQRTAISRGAQVHVSDERIPIKLRRQSNNRVRQIPVDRRLVALTKHELYVRDEIGNDKRHITCGRWSFLRFHSPELQDCYRADL